MSGTFLSANDVLVLRKCDAAARSTTVPGDVKDKAATFTKLREAGLIAWTPMHGNGAHVWRLTDAGREALAVHDPAPRVERMRQAIPTVPNGALPGQLAAGKIVAGAAAEGDGVLTGFRGRGQMTHKMILECLTAGGFPLEWAPSVKSAHAQAGRALTSYNALGYIVRSSVKKATKRTAANAAEIEANEIIARDAKLEGKHNAADALMQEAGGVHKYKARWTVRAVNNAAEVGQDGGPVIMTATVDSEDKLYLESADENLRASVRAKFESLIADEMHSCTDVSTWLKRCLYERFGAGSVGPLGWYIPKQHREDAERFLAPFARRWGEDWILPAIPIANTLQLRAGLASGLMTDLAEIQAKYDEALAERAKHGENGITARMAESLTEDLRDLAKRTIIFGEGLGTDAVAGVRDAICALGDRIIENTLGRRRGIPQRFATHYSNLAREIHARG